MCPVRPYTIDQAIQSMGIGKWIGEDGTPDFTLFRWPPDVFAIAATILRESGAYLHAARPHVYPSDTCYKVGTWAEHVGSVAHDWRTRDVYKVDPPDQVCSAVSELVRIAESPIHELSRTAEDNLDWLPFLRLLSYADHACQARRNGVCRGRGCRT